MKRRFFTQRLAAISLSIVTGLASLGVASIAPAQASVENEAAATAHIDRMIDEMKGVLLTDEGDMATREAAVTHLLDTYFDFPGISRFSAGQYWRTASKEEQAEYTMVIRNVIIGTVVRNFDQLKGLSYTPQAVKAKGKKLVIVSGKFSDDTGARPSVLVNWRVVTRPEQPPRVLDIEIENISMLVTQKQENIAIVRKNKGEFAALIAAMREKLAE